MTVHDPHSTDLQIGDVSIFHIDDLIGGASQSERIGGEKIFSLSQPNHHEGEANP